MSAHTSLPELRMSSTLRLFLRPAAPPKDFCSSLGDHLRCTAGDDGVGSLGGGREGLGAILMSCVDLSDER